MLVAHTCSPAFSFGVRPLGLAVLVIPQRGAISQEDARRAKDYVRDLLYDALRDADTSVEAFEQSISSERVYQHCGITRTANPRGRPPKEKAGEQS